ncbi:hypothetical protein D6C84_02783 [Aureobasidium pullulans]|uniref:HMG box domain-containing protein n=1 Tax=Aureobasidium pullulans TaxID=5580 RepID=A0A4S9Y2T7_AURPU|nr:hypothetical protein D6C84_02783 [Aureobasidium pullulans]
MLALRLPLRLAARAGPSNARLATPVVASSLSASRSYRTKADGSTTPKKKEAAGTTVPKNKAGPISKTAAKEAAAKKAYKLLSPEEQAAISEQAKEAKAKEQIKLLKAKALSPPKNRQLANWAIYVRENAKDRAQGSPVTTVIKQLAEEFRNLSTREKEHLNHQVNEANAKSLREYEEWLHGHTPAEILAANNARLQLRNKLADTGNKYMPIKDDRLVKRARGSWIIFHSERFSSGDFRGIKAGDAAKDIAVEFNALSASERKKYEDLAAKDLERYAREYREIYGVEKPDWSKKTKSAPST